MPVPVNSYNKQKISALRGCKVVVCRPIFTNISEEHAALHFGIDEFFIFTLKNEVELSSRTSVNIYKSTRHYIPNDSNYLSRSLPDYTASHHQ
jgi:hypothetical protein